MAISINFNIDQGSKFSGVVTIQNEDGSVYDLTNKTPYSQMRKSYYTSSYHNINAAVEGDSTLGKVRLSLTASESGAIKAGRYVYDVELHNDNDVEDVKRVLQGIITISPQVTQTVIP